MSSNRFILSIFPLQCVGFHPYTQRCGEGLLYDGAKHECVSRHSENIKCGPQPIGKLVVLCFLLSRVRCSYIIKALGKIMLCFANIYFFSFPSLSFFSPLCGCTEEKTKEEKEADPFAALPCDTIECDVPYCFCSHKGDKIPGGLNPQDVSTTCAGEGGGVGISFYLFNQSILYCIL